MIYEAEENVFNDSQLKIKNRQIIPLVNKTNLSGSFLQAIQTPSTGFPSIADPDSVLFA